MKTLFLAFTVILSYQVKELREPEGLKVGEKAPAFTAVDIENNTFNSNDALKNGPLVVIFYRGQWCPVCSKHLTGIEDNLSAIEEQGATLVAISPERTELLEKTKEKTGASFNLLHDVDHEICKAFDVLFTPKKGTVSMYNTMLGADLKNAHSDGTVDLPVPATYIIDTDGTIVWRHFDTDYKNRASAADILANLP